MICKRCNKKQAKYLQLHNVHSATTWEASCGCGEEPMYYLEIGNNTEDTHVVEHVSRKVWCRPALVMDLVYKIRSLHPNLPHLDQLLP